MNVSRKAGQNRHQITSGFAKLGGGVTTQTVVGTKTAGDSPNGVRLNPQLRKAASPLYAMGERQCDWEAKGQSVADNDSEI